MKIHELMTSEGDPTYFEEGFMQVIETHLTYLKGLSTNRPYTFSAQVADKYHGDFYGLLDYFQIPKKYHHVTMLINGLMSSSDYGYEKTSIILPDYNELELLKAVYSTGGN